MVDFQTIILEKAFAYYREHGFPYVAYTDGELWEMMLRLTQVRTHLEARQRGFLSSSQVTTTAEGALAGMHIPYQFHRHIWDSYAEGMCSPMQAFSDDVKLKKALRLAYEKTNTVAPHQLRNKLKIVSFTQMCSNFRPAVAFNLMYEFLPKGGTVFDPCAGYGGRLTAALAHMLTGHCAGYECTDPQPLTVRANKKLASFFTQSPKVLHHSTPIEETKIEHTDHSLAMTSPPYFRKEVYDTGASNHLQSRARYGDYAEWRNVFLVALCAKMQKAVRRGSYVLINIQDVNIKGVKIPLVADTISTAGKIGLRHVKTMDMGFAGFGKGLAKKKTEAVLVFQKT